jgi:membrane-bound lytic murein transglycosylase D
MLASCATTKPEPEATVDDFQPLKGAVVQNNGTESVDKHLYIPTKAPKPPAGQGEKVYTDVWERMRDSYALPECSRHESAEQWARWYADRPEYIERVLNRAQPWLWFIIEEIEFRDMPGELALLPIVESAYDPFAYSSGRALGAWQFISTTGRHYGLKQDWWYDGRRDVWASTHAALDYLVDLHELFEGDWLLALASYNAGEGRVGRAVAKNKAAGKKADFWNLRLPRETQGYVPKLMGLACLFRDPASYGLTLPTTPDQQVVTAFDFQQQTDLVLLSQVAEVGIDVLFTLNPGFNRWATSPEGPWSVVLPLDGAERLEKRLQTLNPNALMKWDQVTVQEGDSLSELARVHHVPVGVIRGANSLQSDLIRPGQKLRLPRDEQLLVDPLYATAAAELSRLQAGLLASERINHKVRAGESLSVIARRYGVSVKNLQDWNKISDPRKLRAGQQLVVFHSPAPQVSRPTSAEYTVRSGDSLWSIARKHRVKMNDLMRWNGLNSNSVLQPGQSLKILF